MTLCDCYLDGVHPGDLDPAVVLLDVRELPPETETVTLPVAGRDGLRLTSARRGPLTVCVDLEIHEPDPARRKDIARKLARWAAPGGYLTLGDRPGQRLRVSCLTPLTLASVLHWTQPVTVVFTALDMPWWQELHVAQAEAAKAARSGTLTLRPTGDLPTPLEARVACEGTVNTLTLTAGGARIELTGLGLKAGDDLVLDYDEHALLRLHAAGRSALCLRTPESADDLWLTPRADNAVTWQADGPVRPRVTARGRCL